MLGSWIDPVVKNYLFHGSLLRKPGARRSFATENTIQLEELSSENPVVMREDEKE